MAAPGRATRCEQRRILRGNQAAAAAVGTGVTGTIHAALLREHGWVVSHLVRRDSANVKPKSVEIDLLDLRKGHERHSDRRYECHLAATLPPDASFVLVRFASISWMRC